MVNIKFVSIYGYITRMKEKLRILFLFAHLHKGGMQRAVSNISIALPCDFEQYVCFFGTENPDFKFNAKMHDFDLDGTEKKGLFSKLVNSLRRLSAIRAFVRENRIDTVVSFGESANIYNILSRHCAKKIISSRVALDESLEGKNLYANFYRRLVPALYPRADIVVAVSEQLGEKMRFIVKNKTKIKVIPNLYDTSEIFQLSQETLPSEIAFLEERRFILNVGSFCYQKGQDDLITIYSNLSKKYNDLLLVIIGNGELKQALVDQAKLLGVSDKVYLLNFDSNPFRYMSRATVFVLPSRFEGFPNVLVEAMICGAPVVSFDCLTGPKEILGSDNKYGILLKDRNYKRAEDAISCLLDDEQYRSEICSSGKKRSNNYSSDIVIGKWIETLTCTV